MRLFITGATGLIGRRLVADRISRGDTVIALSRNASKAAEANATVASDRVKIVESNPMRGGAWQDAIDGCDGVVNLAGAGIADRRWNAKYKQLIVDSRVQSTQQVVQAIRTARSRPRVLVNASAVGYYGDRGDEIVVEESAAGQDFLAQSCVAWEAAAQPAAELGVRVVVCRFGVVLDRGGGALPKMSLPFRLFAGGPIGNGRAYMPWVHVEDAVGAIGFALERQEIEGPVNVTAPELARNASFSRALGRALGRPSWLPVPRIALRVVMGEVAKYATASCGAMPGRLQELGYTFKHSSVEEAMQALFRATQGM